MRDTLAVCSRPIATNLLASSPATATEIAVGDPDELRYESARVYIPVLEEWIEEAEVKLSECDE